ncbi:MAG: NADH-quinone oxidoreductase subunit M [Polyangiales bacterium]
MNAIFDALRSFWPVLAAGTVGAFVPRRPSRTERFWFAFAAAATVLFLLVMWPDAVKPIVDDATAPAPAAESFPHLLSWLIAIPAIGAIAVLFTPRQSHKLLQWLTLAIMGAELVGCLLLLKLTPQESGYWLEENAAWIPSIGVRYHVAVDGISLWLIVLTGLMTPIATFVSFGSITHRVKDFCFSFLLLQAAMVGSLLAIDLFLFYVMWELMLIPMYVLIGVWGSTDRIRAAIKFFIFTMTGSMLMLAAMLYVVFKYRALSGELSWDLGDLMRLHVPFGNEKLLFGAFALAFLIKVPMFPVHTWLPDAHTQAPTGASIILAAVMLKLGCYGYVRFAMNLFPRAAHEYGATLAGIAVVGGIMYGALCALKQTDAKRLIAYSSVAHLGYVMLGIFARNQASMEGAILQMVNHGISTGALFLLIGVIYDRRHTRELAEFGGLAKVMPWYAAVFVIVTFSSIGLPGTNGFIGEWLVISGTFLSNQTLGIWGRSQAMGAALGVILGAAYMLTVTQKMFFGPLDNPKNRRLPDLTRRESIALAPLIVLIFAIGLFPRVFTEPMHPTVTAFVKQFGERKLFEETRVKDTPMLEPKAPTASSPTMAMAMPQGGK